jgi:hypothetical protein
MQMKLAGKLRQLALICSALLAHAGLAQAAGITPEPIPPKYGIPGDQKVIQAYTDKNDVGAMRNHAWQIWEGLTADSKSSYEGKVLPIWETWLATNQVFTNPPQSLCETCEIQTLSAPAREFKSPHQFSHGAALLIAKPGKQNPGGLVGFNKFDPGEVKFLWTPHQQNGATFNYTSYTDLTNLNATWADGTKIQDAKIIGTPRSSIELKPVLSFVAAKTLTAIPYWQGPKASTDAACANVNVEHLKHPSGRLNPSNCHPDPTTWTNCILVDAANPTAALRAATAAEFSGANLSQAAGCTSVSNVQYVGIDSLYHFKMTAKEATDFNNFQENGQKEASAGDSMVLVAMHVNTKEITNWTWETFWWQAGQKTPDNYPGDGAGRPKTLGAPWSNYNMCASYSQTTKPDNKGEMNVCFNPYLETSGGIPDGIRSNCATCHGTAAFNQPPTGGYPLSYALPVDLNSVQYFLCSTQTDFSYAIQGNQANAPANPPAWACNRK